jgi:hypothetical protein
MTSWWEAYRPRLQSRVRVEPKQCKWYGADDLDEIEREGTKVVWKRLDSQGSGKG